MDNNDGLNMIMMIDWLIDDWSINNDYTNRKDDSGDDDTPCFSAKST